MIDVSYCMGAADVAPTRLQVAKEAAAAVVGWQPQDVLIGVVAFSGNAQLVQAPTGSRTAVLEALNKLELQSGSALGTGLLGSLMTLFPEHDLAGGYDVFGHYVPRFAYPPVHRSRDEATQPADHKRVRPGSNALARIVVLSDGQSTHGVPIEVAQAIAGDYGVRVFTVGIGTAGGGTVEVSGQLFRVGFDEKNLVDIASRTQGVHWRLNDVTDVARVFDSMRAAAAYEPRVEEMSVYLSALGLCLLLAAAILSSRPYPVMGGERIVDR
jgi:Ca-activated chloride channel family protein